ncbi:bacteriocin-type signal sequence domain protein [Clostridium argentinense CDC 2741]|uniref:Bacteriocin-type signal sequence domain protein n=2 Tax=Clostridium argentinense TaxID=29341 RepID=A0A0C1TWC7_9CLOT|nr:bacteriocin [Clostridium argentinense]ARC83152.1 bacteriocin leader domain-containing protein [Clostridium argentinense]KIE44994.1 bacteriocin-type signal sequence domain protein [Clostridium argentinense CDC 2741]NFF41606.1 bacteriocin [Clostridium argentinense]NFP52306.1 bacteriocin [Clostridium argentinense]NFP74681.1 bacteriocin [Clostridium argentinense]
MRSLRGIKVLNENDMKSITGGAANIPVSRRFLDKNICLEEARALVHYRGVSGMSLQEIAEEIYAHAVFYYQGLTANEIAKALSKSGLAGFTLSAALTSSIADILISKGEVINIEDGGDTSFRKLVYKGVWIMF